jgi:ABC-type siderophore export system fused ATPase/permease subunit
MKVRDLIKESSGNPLSKKQKDKLRDVLSSMFDTIQRFEKNGKVEGKSDKEKVEMLKDTINSMIKSKDREKTIRGED